MAYYYCFPPESSNSIMTVGTTHENEVISMKHKFQISESIRLGEEYKALAQKRKIPFADTRGWNIDLTFDGVHFTEAGHHRFAEKLCERFHVF